MLTLCIADVERDAGMKNLSRKEAMEILNDMKVKIEIPKAAVMQNKRNAALDMAIEALKCSEIPNCSDCISRQAAIAVANRADYRGLLVEDVKKVTDEVVKGLKQLPSAQPETHEKRTETHACDLIGRQAAIDIFDDYNVSVENGELEAYSRDRKRLCELPSAQPEPEELDFVQPHKKIDVRLEIGQPEPQWIPCSDPSDLPKDKRLWITREISDGFFTLREVSDVIWDMTEWSGSVSNVVAYMPYWEPEPYKERMEE